MKKSDDNLIERTLEVWQPRNAQRLSDEDARAILENVKGFFTLLLEWETNEQQKKGGDQDDSYFVKVNTFTITAQATKENAPNLTPAKKCSKRALPTYSKDSYLMIR